MEEPHGPMLRFADAAVTYIADQFHGIYRGKKYHESDWAEVLHRARQYGCEQMMLTTMNLAGAYQNLEVVQQYADMCTMTLGLDRLREFGQRVLGEHPSCLATFGEIGLDYEYLDRADKQTQQRAFRDQLDLAIQMQLPRFLHVRSSCSDFIEIIKPYLPKLPRGGLMHSFAGSKNEMLQLVDLGIEISVNGVCFLTEEQLEMVRHIPLNRLQLETDAPWCEIVMSEAIAMYLDNAHPLPASRKYGKFISGQMVKGRNESCTMERVAMVVAGLKKVSVEEIADAAWNNSVRMFGLPN